MNTRTYIKNLRAGMTFVMIPNTVYRATRVRTEDNLTSVTYTVEGSHFRGETAFTRPSLTTCEVV